MIHSIADIRKTYAMGSFNETDAHANPFIQFNNWWQDAINSEIDEVNALTLATVDAMHKPHARIVLLKGVDETGFYFYTNYNSHKGQEIEANNNGAMVFFWKELERQIRIEGIIQKATEDNSNAYFLSRPFESRIGAITSPQSEVIASRHWLEEKEAELKKNLTEATALRPKHWGGYVLIPGLFEFWQGRPSRLHDRLLYDKTTETGWKISRLAP
jgi:pyridoxamine 5'-phosphate oxidase